MKPSAASRSCRVLRVVPAAACGDMLSKLVLMGLVPSVEYAGCRPT